jgi:hypothetical protein
MSTILYENVDDGFSSVSYEFTTGADDVYDLNAILTSVTANVTIGSSGAVSGTLNVSGYGTAVLVSDLDMDNTVGNVTVSISGTTLPLSGTLDDVSGSFSLDTAQASVSGSFEGFVTSDQDAILGIMEFAVLPAGSIDPVYPETVDIPVDLEIDPESALLLQWQQVLTSLQEQKTLIIEKQIVEAVGLIAGAVDTTLGLALNAPAALAVYIAILASGQGGLDAKQAIDDYNTAIADPSGLNILAAATSIANVVLDLNPLSAEFAGAMKLALLAPQLGVFIGQTQTELNTVNAQINSVQNQINQIEAYQQSISQLLPIPNPTVGTDPFSGATIDGSTIDFSVQGSSGTSNNWIVPLGTDTSTQIINPDFSAPISELTNGAANVMVLNDYVSLTNSGQTVVVAANLVGNIIIDGHDGSKSTVDLQGNYGSYQVTLGNNALVAQNASLTVIVENVNQIVFNDNTITFDANGNPTVARTGAPSVGTTYYVDTSQGVITGFNQVPNYDPLHGDKIEFVGATARATADNFIAAPDLVSTYQDALNLADELLQNFRYVAIAYDQGTSDSGSTTVEPASGQNFMLLFVDMTGNHQADAVVRLIGLDNVSEISFNDLTIFSTPAVVQSDYLAIARTSLPLDQATTEANAINGATTTEIQYINSLLSQVADTTVPVVAVEGSMYGAVGSSAVITNLVTNFLPGQIAYANQNGLDPGVFACLETALVFAFANESGSTAFTNNFGPSNSAMPATAPGDAAFAAAATNAIFGSAQTANTANALLGYVNFLEGFFTANGIVGVQNPTADQIVIAARAGAWGEGVAIALENNLGSLPGQTTNFLEDAAQGTAIYSASFSSQATPALFQGQPTTSATASVIQVTGVATPVDHIVM